MAPTTTTGPTLEGPLTLEDLALIADGTGNVPDATATRLQALFSCEDPDEVEYLWRCYAAALADLRRMAADAGVELLADGLYVHRLLERLRTEPWDAPADLIDPRLDVPYRELIAMTRARAGRAEGEEKAELGQLVERLGAALGAQIRGDSSADLLIDRLLEVGADIAEEALDQLVGLYRDRRAAAEGSGSRG